MRESHVEKHLVSQVEATGGLVRKLQWVGRRSAPDRLVGWPVFNEGDDPVRWRDEAHALIETKRPKGKARADQEREHERLRAIGFDVRVLDTIEAVNAFIEEMTS